MNEREVYEKGWTVCTCCGVRRRDEELRDADQAPAGEQPKICKDRELCYRLKAEAPR